MATRNPSPSPDDARAALAQADRDADAVRYPPIPRWFFILQAAAIAGVLLAQLLEPSDALKATFAVVVVSAVLGSRFWLNRRGVAWASPRVADVLPSVVAVVLTCVVCWVLSAFTDAWWVWVVGAGAAGSVILHTGYRYGQAFGHGR